MSFIFGAIITAYIFNKLNNVYNVTTEKINNVVNNIYNKIEKKRQDIKLNNRMIEKQKRKEKYDKIRQKYNI
jgi:predicted ATP-grasp superfamily ATP-dependent carboligase